MSARYSIRSRAGDVINIERAIRNRPLSRRCGQTAAGCLTDFDATSPTISLAS